MERGKNKRMEFLRAERTKEILFLCGIFVFTLMWSLQQPPHSSPDEGMRYQLTDYIATYMKLPHGGDPLLRDEVWGISYAFNPILPNMISAVFLKIARLFSVSSFAELMAARMVNILSTVGTGYFVLRIGERSFSRKGKWVFAFLIMMMPETIYLGSYLNNDAMALFSCAWMMYLWVRAASEKTWTWKLCAQMGVAVSICALTYYNAYGFILCSMILFAVTFLWSEKHRWDIREMFRKGMFIAVIFAVLAGWWFIRSYIIYDGDILGMKTSSYYSGLYAQEEYKPWNRMTPQKMGMSILQMLFWIPQGMDRNWLVNSWSSFVGSFITIGAYKPLILDKICFGITGFGGICIFLKLRETFTPHIRKIQVTKRKEEKEIIVIKKIETYQRWSVKNCMHLVMIPAAAIPLGLAVWYSYTSDYQAQGRYFFSAILPMMYLVTLGYQYLHEKIRKEWVARLLMNLLLIWMVFLLGYVYLEVFYPAYSSLW